MIRRFEIERSIIQNSEGSVTALAPSWSGLLARSRSNR